MKYLMLLLLLTGCASSKKQTIPVSYYTVKCSESEEGSIKEFFTVDMVIRIKNGSCDLLEYELR